jgi:hypothetical protein
MLLEEGLEDLVYITPVLAGECVGDHLALDSVEFPIIFIVVGWPVWVVTLLLGGNVRCGS